jgi:hypothetical protein
MPLEGLLSAVEKVPSYASVLMKAGLFVAVFYYEGHKSLKVSIDLMAGSRLFDGHIPCVHRLGNIERGGVLIGQIKDASNKATAILFLAQRLRESVFGPLRWPRS